MQIKLLSELREELEEAADPRARAWWENYVKDGAPFLGVKMSVIRSLVEDWHGTMVEDELDAEEQVELARDLIREEYSEEKLAGILYLQVILIPSGVVDCRHELDQFAELFDEGNIYDWNICDWFAVKVLGPLIRDQGTNCAEAVSGWSRADNLWRARASLVPFVKVADNSDYYPLIADSCRVLLGREERFAKTAAGWVLRDISRYDPGFVKQVVRDNLKHFSAESLRNASKYLDNRESLERQLRESGTIAQSDKGRSHEQQV